MNDKRSQFILINIMNDIVNNKKGHNIMKDIQLCSTARRLTCCMSISLKIVIMK